MTGFGRVTEPMVVTRSTGWVSEGCRARSPLIPADPLSRSPPAPSSTHALVVLLQGPHLQLVARGLGYAVGRRHGGRPRRQQRHVVATGRRPYVGAVG